ncbi:hypothetical protein SUDANB126_00167 [Streptomyces sp. enrichment culture]
MLDVLIQNRRDGAAARRFLRKLLERTRTVPRVIVTDELRSCRAAHREVMPSVEHRQSKHLGNRAEKGHRPARRKGFRSAGGRSGSRPRSAASHRTSGPAT